MTAMVSGSTVLKKYWSGTEFPTNPLQKQLLTYWTKAGVNFAIYFSWDLQILPRLSCYSHLLSSSKPFWIRYLRMGRGGAFGSHFSKRLSLGPPNNTVVWSSSYVRGTACTPTSTEVTLLQRHCTPIFGTSKLQLIFVREGVVVERETEMIKVRWRIFHLSRQILQQDLKAVPPCGKLFARLVLSEFGRVSSEGQED